MTTFVYMSGDGLSWRLMFIYLGTGCHDDLCLYIWGRAVMATFVYISEDVLSCRHLFIYQRTDCHYGLRLYIWRRVVMTTFVYISGDGLPRRPLFSRHDLGYLVTIVQYAAHSTDNSIVGSHAAM